MANNKSVENTSLASLQAEEDKLKAQLAAIAEKRQAAEIAKTEKLANQVRGLPALLGVGSLSDVISLVRQVDKGTLGKLATDASRSYVRLTDAQKAEIVEKLKGGAQASALVAQYGVSAPTIQAIKKDAGLVKSYAPRDTAETATAQVPA